MLLIECLLLFISLSAQSGNFWINYRMYYPELLTLSFLGPNIFVTKLGLAATVSFVSYRYREFLPRV